MLQIPIVLRYALQLYVRVITAEYRTSSFSYFISCLKFVKFFLQLLLIPFIAAFLSKHHILLVNLLRLLTVDISFVTALPGITHNSYQLRIKILSQS